MYAAHLMLALRAATGPGATPAACAALADGGAAARAAALAAARAEPARVPEGRAAHASLGAIIDIPPLRLPCGGGDPGSAPPSWRSPRLAALSPPPARPPSRPSAPRPPLPPDLEDAAASGDVVALHAALDGGADVGAADAVGRTALHLAAGHGHAAVAAALLAAGADVGALDAASNTPLTYAAAYGQAGVAAALARAPGGAAAATLPNDEGLTPAAVAAVNGHGSVADMLGGGWE